MAYIKNGYVYHTLHDNPSMIQPGAVQRAGDNIHGVVKHFVQSTESLLPDPSEYRYGNVVYLDIFGLTMVIIPMWITVMANYATLALVLIYLGRKMVDPTLSGRLWCSLGIRLHGDPVNCYWSFVNAHSRLFITIALFSPIGASLPWATVV